MQHLEKLLVPNCKNIPNDFLCKLLTLNPSLLDLDISNKMNPFIDQAVVTTIVKSCRYLTVLKLSDYRLEDPENLLVLCGRVAVRVPPVNSNQLGKMASEESCTLNPDSTSEWEGSEALMERVTNMMLDSSTQECCAGEGEPSCAGACACGVQGVLSEYVDAQSKDGDTSVFRNNIMENAIDNGRNLDARGDRLSTREEEKNRRGQNVSRSSSESSEAGNRDERLYEDDSSVCPLEVQDHSGEFGCLELETLWLDNVNLSDQVAAVLLQALLHLRDINLSNTDICNPWRLVDKSYCNHMKFLEDLDVKSTALSRTALEMIPDFHPNLRRLSISSTTLPPPTYKNITKLTGIVELELIGGQFYPCEPDEIFTNGIVPAVNGVGGHLQSLSLTYFAHVEFSKIIMRCPMIRHMDLSRTEIFVTSPCPSIGEHCPNLINLNLGYARIEARDTDGQIVSEAIAIQHMMGEPPMLEELHLCGLTVTDDFLRTMYHRAKYPLESLNVSRCKKLTIAGIRDLWMKCPLLTYIDVTHCKEVTPADCRAFEASCRETRPIFKLEGIINWK